MFTFCAPKRNASKDDEMFKLFSFLGKTVWSETQLVCLIHVSVFLQGCTDTDEQGKGFASGKRSAGRQVGAFSAPAH